MRKILTTAGSFTMGRLIPQVERQPTEEIEILACQVAGYQYHNGSTIEQYLYVGKPIRLVREPYNIHDYCAIAVYIEDVKVGYIPMEYNFVLARLLSGGLRINGHVGEFRAHMDPWERLWIYIHMEVDPSRLVKNEIDQSGKRDSSLQEIRRLYQDF